jgi:NitT/TauT family transport system permease protein
VKPLTPVAPGARAALGAAFFVVFVAVWAGFTLGGFVSKTFLADPITMVKSGWTLLTQMGFAHDIGMTVWRVVGGFVIAALLALPLGVAMGAYKHIEAFFEPFVSFARYLPASAFIPLLILWAGIGEAQKLAVIFIGTFFQQLVMVADIAHHVPRDLLDVSYTLGATRRQVVSRVLIPATLPGVMDTLRISMGWAWTYLVVAELLAANKGLGYMILNSMRGLFTDRIFLGIMVIGLLGLITDQCFKYLHRWLLPWSPKAG